MIKLKEADITSQSLVKITTRLDIKIPEWVDSWLELYKSNREKDIIIKELKN